ncbi:MAG: SDR family oxidoreductase [Clostridiales bacterium]|jgi:NAD(P)-dependent dehydrogenase (short-subunit alcohol dehydrogenase family)|nr:SDR family oxidoreductase [Clostridiales bacterium]
MLLNGKVIAITGGGAGIGGSASRLFAKEGARVVILEVNAEAGERTAAEIRAVGGDAVCIRTDVSDPDSVREAFEKIDRLCGCLDGLYNNAGVFLGKYDNRVTELSLETWEKILRINLFGVFYCCKYGIPLMKKAGGGAIVLTSSSAGVIGIPDCDAYTAAKGAAVALTRSLAVEYGPDGIRTNCIAPAAIRTEMVKESNLNDPKFDEQAFLDHGTPLRRWGTPEEVAELAAFLFSDRASYLNGAIIRADGGITVM